MFKLNFSTEAKVIITSTLFFLPLTLSECSFRGYLIVFLFYLIIGVFPNTEKFFIKYIPKMIFAVIFIISSISIPFGLLEIFRNNFEVLTYGAENIFYAFKKYQYLVY